MPAPKKKSFGLHHPLITCTNPTCPCGKKIIDSFVRDVTKVHPSPKSYVRRRTLELLQDVLEEVLPVINEMNVTHRYIMYHELKSRWGKGK